MKTKLVIEATELEILALINKHCNVNEDSIVALEELGNEDWVVNVSPARFGLEDDFLTTRDGEQCLKQFHVRNALDYLCSLGHLEEGDYIIDCTW